MRVHTLTVSFVALTLSLFFVDSIRSEEYHEINGQVLDDKNNPISSVEVKIYCESRKQAESYTDENGNYRLRFKKGTVIDTLSYYHTNWNPGIINGLSGARDHKINKTLYRLGSRLSNVARVGIISAIENLYMIDLDNRISRREINEKYKRAIGNLGITIGTIEREVEVKRQKQQWYE